MVPEDAQEKNEQGLELEAQGRWEEAAALYEEALTAAPLWPFPWHNLGLLYKHRRDWPKSLHYNRKAVELAPDDEGAWWNLGIAATALGDWSTARSAWTHFGVKAPGVGPIELDLGLVPIRIRPEEAPEVLWCKRIDPARAVIASVPLPASGRHWRDLLLHDGEPKGKRRMGDRDVSVFDEIERLTASPYSTFEVEIECAAEEDLTALLRAFEKLRRVNAEDWTSSLHWLCKACSEGHPHEEHEPHPARADGWESHRRLGVAALEAEDFRPTLDRWVAAGRGRHVHRLELVSRAEAVPSSAPPPEPRQRGLIARLFDRS